MNISNKLLNALPQATRKRMLAESTEVELKIGEELSVPGDRIGHVYFPLSAFISLIVEAKDRRSLEVGLIGNEGMLGTAVMLGVETSPLRALVQGPGTALRMTTKSFKSELVDNAALGRHLQRYCHVLNAQLSHTALCNRFHQLEARLAHWLLLTHDRSHADTFHLTHDALGRILGVRRVGITNAAGVLQERGIISYHRGEITIVNRPAMEKVSCDCYRTNESIYEQFLQ